MPNINLFETNWNGLAPVNHATIQINFVPNSGGKLFYDFTYSFGNSRTLNQGHITLVADNLEVPHVTLINGEKGKKTNYHFRVTKQNTIDVNPGLPTGCKADKGHRNLAAMDAALLNYLRPQLQIAFAGYMD